MLVVIGVLLVTGWLGRPGRSTSRVCGHRLRPGGLSDGRWSRRLRHAQRGREPRTPSPCRALGAGRLGALGLAAAHRHAHGAAAAAAARGRRRSRARCSRSGASTRARSRTYLADNPTSGPWLDRLGAVRGLLLALVRGDLPAAVRLAGGLRAAAQRGCTGGPCARRPPAAPRSLEPAAGHASDHVEPDAGGGPRGCPDGAAPAAATGRADDEGSVVGGEGLPARDRQPGVPPRRWCGLLVGVAPGSFLGYKARCSWSRARRSPTRVPRYDTSTPGPRGRRDDLAPFRSPSTTSRCGSRRGGGNQFGAPRDFQADRALTAGAGRRRRSSVHACGSTSRWRSTAPRCSCSATGTRRCSRCGTATGEVVSGRPGAVPAAGRQQHLDRRGQGAGRAAAAARLRGRSCCRRRSGRRRPARSRSTPTPLPRAVLTAWTGDLGVDDGTPQSVYVLDTSRMSQLRQDGRPFSASLAPGQTVTLPDGAGTVTFDGLKPVRGARHPVRPDEGLGARRPPCWRSPG